jgi:hypothetical protein
LTFSVLPSNLIPEIESLFSQIDAGVRYSNAGGQPYGEAQYVSIEFLLVLATGTITLACAEWKHRVPVEQSWEKIKVYFSNAHREHHLVYQTALRSDHHTTNMILQAPVGQLPRSSNVADLFHSAPMTNEQQGPNIATTLANLATVTFSDRTTVAALTNALAELTDFMQSQTV